MRQPLLFISPVMADGDWQDTLQAVKAPLDCFGWKTIGFYYHHAVFSVGIPQRLKVTTDDTIIVAHSEIRDLGTDPVSNLSVAGLSNTIVAQAFRGKGIYTTLIKLRNLVIDHTDFDCVAARVKLGYEDRYMAQYPGFCRVKDQDPHGAAWILRETPGKALERIEYTSVVSYLEREVKKW